MAMPGNSGSSARTPREAWDTIRATVGQIKTQSVRLRDDSLAGDVAADRVTRYVVLLADALNTFAVWTTVPGLLAYAREQLDNPAFDLVAEYNAMHLQVVATRDWIVTNFPADGNGYLLYHSFGPGGRITVRQLTTGQLAGLRTILDALIASID